MRNELPKYSEEIGWIECPPTDLTALTISLVLPANMTGLHGQMSRYSHA